MEYIMSDVHVALGKMTESGNVLLFQIHLRKVMTNSISSVRHIICTQHSRREGDSLRKHLFSGITYPVTV